jgi:hypothetical protein
MYRLSADFCVCLNFDVSEDSTGGAQGFQLVVVVFDDFLFFLVTKG